MTSNTKVVRIPSEIYGQAEAERERMIEEARSEGNNELLPFLIGAGIGAFLGYLIVKSLDK